MTSNWNARLFKTKIQYRFHGCPWCGNIAEPVFIDVNGTVALCECKGCGIQCEPHHFVNVEIDYWLDCSGKNCKPGIADLVKP